MGIPCHVQRGATLCSCLFGTAINQCAPDAASPHVRFDKEAVELHLAVRSGQRNGKSDDGAGKLGNENLAPSYVLSGQFDGIWIREQRVTITRIPQRRTPLKLFEVSPLT
jgi:hypothetical protein